MDDVRPGYKHTEVGVIPEDWEISRLEEVCTLINGRGFKPHEWQTEGLPIVRIQNLNGSNEFNYYSGQFDPKILIDSGQLLFAWSGSRGTSFGPHIWYGDQALLNYHTWKVDVDHSKIDPDYFFHALRQLTKYIEDNAHGASALVHTQKGEMEKFFVPLPPTLDEQRAIADALSEVDAEIAALDDLIAKKRDLKQGAMQRLLTGEERLPGFSGAWEVKSIKNIAPLQRGFDLPASQIQQGQYPVVYSNGVQNFHNSYTCPGPGVVTGRSGTLGAIHYVEKEFWAHNTTLWVTDFKGNDPKYIYYLYLFVGFERFGSGSGVPTLNRNDAHEYSLTIPTIFEEQGAIAAVLSDMDAEITALEAHREKTVALKQGMMQDLLTGKVRLV